jgi:hypothetical protein
MRIRCSSAVILILAGALLAACRETYETTYRSMDDAQKAGALHQGWLPAFLPPGAAEIRERHDIDTNEIWGSFDFTQADDTALRQALPQVELRELDGRAITSGRVGWWPDALSGPLQEGTLSGSGFSFYKDSKGYFAAINWRERRCFFWRKRFW